MVNKKRNIKRSNILQLGLVLAIIVLVNIISSFLFTRIDLTAEKRYSLAPATKKLLKSLDDDLYFRIYLDGELPSGFRRLANETREMLNEFRAYSDYIHFEFIDPSENPNPKERNETYRLLAEQGLQPTDLRVTEKGQSSQLIIFPGALATFQGKELSVNLLQSQLGQNPESALNASIESLEFNLAIVMAKLTDKNKPRIAFIDGQGGLTRGETIDLEESLSEYYSVERIVINNKINSLTVRLQTDSSGEPLVNKFKAIIIAGATKPFNEKDKFLIDQYIMRGGRVLWLLDPVFASMDSLERYASTIGIANDMNLEDLLFNYGAKLNSKLVMDLNALPIPVKTGQVGNQPQFEYFEWYFFPLLMPVTNHPVVRGLNAIKTEFISRIDTVIVPGVNKEILLTTSPYSRTVNAPALIDLDILKDEPDRRMFNSGPQPVAILLEGEFPSAYRYRIPPELQDNEDLQFREHSKATRMVVIGDADVAKNQFHFGQKYPMPLGYDQYTRQQFGNKDLLLNIMNYLCDDSGLISVRSREIALRLLDKTKLASQKTLWQAINIVVPVLLISLFGLIKLQLRKRRYAKNH